MKENSVLITPTGIEKVTIDFENFDNVNKLLHADRVTVINNQKTKEMCQRLRINIMVIANSMDDAVNNCLTCKLFGDEMVNSSVFLCKTDDSYNALPFKEEELDRIYDYLSEGKVVLPKNLYGGKEFFEKYDIESVLLPAVDYAPEAYFDEDMPHVLFLKYNLAMMTDRQLGVMGEAIHTFPMRVEHEGFKDFDDVKLSPDGKYYINYALDSEKYRFNVLLQATDGGKEILIGDVLSLVKKFLRE